MVVVALTVLAAPAAAATITVTTTRDDTTTGDGQCSLRKAIATADGSGGRDCGRADAGANTIVLGPGTYTLSQPNGELAVSPSVRNLAITGAGAGATIIDASALEDRVLTLPPGPSVLISDLTLSGGSAGQAAGEQASSAAAGSGPDGGAIANSATLTLLDADVTNSRAGSGASTSGAPRTAGRGGAIANRGILTLVGSSLTGNRAGDPGSGTAVGGAGGALANLGGSLTIASSTLRANAAGSGGDGGAVWSQGGTVSVLNSTFTANQAGATTGAGSAVAVTSQTAARVLNATIVGNGPGDGVAGPLTLQNTVLALNGPANCGSGTVDGGHNLSYLGGGCPATFASGDPRLGPLQNNGGPTPTFALAPGSAAIDQVPSAGAGCPATDQRGEPRPSGLACDIGAYELEQSALVPPSPPTVVPTSSRVTGRDSVSVSAVVTPAGGSTSVWIEYGRSTGYGARSGFVNLSAARPTLISITLGKLQLHSTYHLQFVAASPNGSSASPDVALAAPIIAGLKASRGRRRHMVITYRDNRRGQTWFTVVRQEPGILRGGTCVPRRRGASGRHCQWVAVNRFSHTDHPGRNRISRVFIPGHFQLLATPNFGATTGTAARTAFAH